MKAMTAIAIALALVLTAPASAQEEDDRPDEVPAWKVQLEAQLKTTVDLNFEDIPASDAFSFLRSIAEINIVVAPECHADEAMVSLQMKSLSIEDVLSMITADNGWQWSLQDGYVLIAPTETEGGPRQGEPEEAEPDAPRPPDKEPMWRAELRKKLQQPTDVDFEAIPAEQAFRFLSESGGVNIYLDPACNAASSKVSMKLKQVSVRNAVALIAAQHDWRWALRYSAVVITTEEGLKRMPEGRLINKPSTEKARAALDQVTLKVGFLPLRFAEVKASDVADFMGMVAGVTVSLDPRLETRKVSVDLTEIQWLYGLKLIAHSIGGEVRLTDEGIFSIVPFEED